MSEANEPGRIGEGGGEHFWLLNTLVSVRVSTSAGKDGISVLEHLAPPEDSPPLHLHRTEDELFYLLEGDFRFLLDRTERRLGPGGMLLVPQGAPHTYRVESKGNGRFITVTTRGDFERFVRTLDRPATKLELPPRSGPPSPGAVEALARIAKDHGIEIVGPPLS